MFATVNGMLRDMLVAVARKDYEDRRRRQAQGIAKAKAAGTYRGQPDDTARNEGIAGIANVFHAEIVLVPTTSMQNGWRQDSEVVG
jgi:DNA invertase Pin-like site-specific DNA recombinase